MPNRNFGKATIGLVSVAAVILGVCALAPGNVAAQTKAAQASSVDQQLAAFLPADAATIAGIDFETLRTTPAFALWETKQGEKARQQLEDFVAATGFDPRRDLDRAFIAILDDGPGAFEARRRAPFILAAKGSFDLRSLEGHLLSGGADVSEHRGVRVFGLTNRLSTAAAGVPDSSRPIALAFLNGGTVLVGTPDLLPAAIDRSFAGGSSLLDRREFVTRGEELGRSHQIWMVSERPAGSRTTAADGPPAENKAAAQVSRILGSLRSSTLALDLAHGLDAEAIGSFEDASAAKGLADVIRGIIAIAQMRDQQAMSSFFDHVQVTDAAERLTLKLQLDQAELEKLIQDWQPRVQAAR